MNQKYITHRVYEQESFPQKCPHTFCLMILALKAHVYSLTVHFVFVLLAWEIIYTQGTTFDGSSLAEVNAGYQSPYISLYVRSKVFKNQPVCICTIPSQYIMDTHTDPSLSSHKHIILTIPSLYHTEISTDPCNHLY